MSQVRRSLLFTSQTGDGASGRAGRSRGDLVRSRSGLPRPIASRPLPIPLVALAGSDLGLRVPLDVLGERAADVITLGESAPLVAADESLVGAGIDELSSAGFLLHGGEPPNREGRRLPPST